MQILPAFIYCLYSFSDQDYIICQIVVLLQLIAILPEVCCLNSLLYSAKFRVYLITCDALTDDVDS